MRDGALRPSSILPRANIEIGGFVSGNLLGLTGGAVQARLAAARPRHDLSLGSILRPVRTLVAAATWRMSLFAAFCEATLRLAKPSFRWWPRVLIRATGIRSGLCGFGLRRGLRPFIAMRWLSVAILFHRAVCRSGFHARRILLAGRALGCRCGTQGSCRRRCGWRRSRGYGSGGGRLGCR